MQEFKHGEADYVFAGSTVALVVLDLERGVIVTGNVGDSKVILGVAGEGDGVEDVVCYFTSLQFLNLVRLTGAEMSNKIP